MSRLLPALLVLLAALLGYSAGRRRWSPIRDLYYWLGWFGPDNQPANGKVVYTIAAFAGTVTFVLMGLRMVTKAMEVTWPYVGLVALVLFFATGAVAYQKFLNHALALKLPGSTTTSRQSQSTETTTTEAAKADG